VLPHPGIKCILEVAEFRLAFVHGTHLHVRIQLLLGSGVRIRSIFSVLLRVFIGACLEQLLLFNE
jgi:hypothetical protein